MTSYKTDSEKIQYCKKEGFGTVKMSLPFSTLQTKKDTELDLVEPAGIEPASARLPKVVLHAQLISYALIQNLVNQQTCFERSTKFKQ